MVLELIDNNELLMNGTEQELFPSQVGLKHYTVKMFFDQMVLGDEIMVRVYDKDEFAGVEKIYRIERVSGVQQSNRLFNWIPSSSFRITCEQVTGPPKTITWALYTS